MTVKLPLVVLVPHSETEALRAKFAASKSAADAEAYWLAVQSARQPAIEENPETLPPYVRQRGIDWEQLPV